MSRFAHFVAIDWSGAAGERQKGIALAQCAVGNAAPALVRPGHRWSRQEVLDWLLHHLPSDSLVGMDLGQSLPFADCGAFFPGWDASPADARALWAMVDTLCADEPHLGVNGFVDATEPSRHFRRHGGRCGDRFPAGRGRLRVTERAQEAMGCKPYSNFNLVGAAQVGKSSLSGMRVLHRLDGQISVWPIDPLPARGSVVCEIYTTIAAMAAGRPASRSKIRDGASLDHALATLGSTPFGHAGAIDDHQSDALITAAWLRTVAHTPALWHPAALTPEIARTEGWTFGAT
ncbi:MULTISPECIES: hypothetical protein [unclassified Novosphingobium]|uniref:hypothetical protein n=1 Tax=unclassified Novosphingobium TaxID=2644732 RepID=UPI000D313EC8|nr:MULTISPECIES: hypothetical protein [unclassified Novosphingobium]PTR12354.1 hypothetical protein C8K11_103278 [Novosphingobium sp. GV055]PUB05755.1 hypothetical protein C8K12_103278 [Novosphingobium sp. GV061]PUB21988.1 hypothetical protein C8K14_103278 [Novosphingobium sp. GV079]PUB43761.1 hypothetical protein C8K10_103278 [Novosphingobium sp. GV027]